MRVLVTGAHGFSGRHLSRYLNDTSSAQIFCTSRRAVSGEGWLTCDLADEQAADALIKRVQPHQIYHLAGKGSNDYRSDYDSNVLSTRNLLESVRKEKLGCRVLLVGSSAEYGAISDGDNPVREDYPLAPVSVYGLTKVYQTQLMKLYCRIYGTNAVMVRPFNLLGKGMAASLFVGRLWEQVAAYKEGTISKILVGNLAYRRDYIGIEQAIRHYSLVMRRGLSGEIYNVGSGASLKIRDLLQGILEENGLNMDAVEETAMEMANKLDIKDIFADTSKLEALISLDN